MSRPRPRAERGQAAVLVLGAAAVLLLGALVLAAFGQALGARGRHQRAADLAAMSAARAMGGAFPRLFEAAQLEDGRPNPRHLSRADYVALAERTAIAAAGRNGVRISAAEVRLPDDFAPTRVTVVAHGEGRVRMAADGPPIRSDAEQARLFAANPNPKWVAPPGTSLHRYGTELDLGSPAAYGWLLANARRFGFIRRYAWEPWHYGFGANPRDRAHPAQYERGSWEPPGGDHARIHHHLPSFVPPRFHDPIARAALRWNVPMSLLAAQLYAESGFNPFARSSAGALGIAQFMPGTARLCGLVDPFDPVAAIDAQAHHMSDLLRRFDGSAALALAAYNAGPAAVERAGGVPPIAETRGYVSRILGLLGGAGEIAVASYEARLVE